MMNWHSIDTQAELDALNQSVCWEDSEVLEYHAGRGHRAHYPEDVSRSGHDRLDIHVLVDASGAPQPFLELGFIACDAVGAEAFDRLHLTGFVDSLKRVEIRAADGSSLFRTARLVYRWLPDAPRDGTHYWPANLR
jgi:hypothetical protein